MQDVHYVWSGRIMGFVIYAYIINSDRYIWQALQVDQKPSFNNATAKDD
jgi:hypothetical protein